MVDDKDTIAVTCSILSNKQGQLENQWTRQGKGTNSPMVHFGQ